jgi:hypothetical protein
LWALRIWLDSWPGIGHVAVGMHRQGFDLQLTQYDERGWRAIFYTTGTEHSATSATGTAWERTAWRVSSEPESTLEAFTYERPQQRLRELPDLRRCFLQLRPSSVCARIVGFHPRQTIQQVTQLKCCRVIYLPFESILEP